MSNEEELVAGVIYGIYEAIREKNFEKLAELHANDYSRFGDLPPLGLMDVESSLRARHGLMTQLLDFSYNIMDLRVKLLGSVALATYYVDYFGILLYSYRFEGQVFRVRSRCTAVLIKQNGSWKLIHEHQSRIKDEDLV